MMVREAIEKDSTSIKHMAYLLGYPPNSDKYYRKQLAQLILAPNHKVWVVEVNGQSIAWLHAFIALRLASKDYAEIGALAVLPEYRHQGIGGALIEQSREWAKEQGLDLKVSCNTKRESAHQFYRALGFEKIKSQHIFELKT